MNWHAVKSGKDVKDVQDVQLDSSRKAESAQVTDMLRDAEG